VAPEGWHTFSVKLSKYFVTLCKLKQVSLFDPNKLHIFSFILRSQLAFMIGKIIDP